MAVGFRAKVVNGFTFLPVSGHLAANRPRERHKKGRIQQIQAQVGYSEPSLPHDQDPKVVGFLRGIVDIDRLPKALLSTTEFLAQLGFFGLLAIEDHKRHE